MAYWLWKVLRKLIANVHHNCFTVVENWTILDQFIPDCINPDSGLNATNIRDYTVFLIIILLKTVIPSSRISQPSSHMQLCMHIYETRIPFSTRRLEGVIQRYLLSLLRIDLLPRFLWSSKSFTLPQPANHLFIKINLLHGICTQNSHVCCGLCW